jgi:hypothetical protein
MAALKRRFLAAVIVMFRPWADIRAATCVISPRVQAAHPHIVTNVQYPFVYPQTILQLGRNLATLRQLKKIAEGKPVEQQEVIEALLRENRIDAEVIETLLRTPDGGSYLPPRTLVDLLAKSSSLELYLRVKQHLFQDVWALVDLFRSDYPDPDIEKNLLDKLLRFYDEDDYPIRRHIVEALRDRGSLNSLRLLTELLDEHIPKATLKTTLAKAMQEVPDRVEFETSPLLAAVENEFVAVLRTAIQEIARRAKDTYESGQETAPQASGVASLPIIPSDEVDRVLELKGKAWYYLEKDTAPALQNARLVVEIVLKALCRQRSLGKPNKPLDKMMVGALLELVEERHVLPPHIEPLVGSINKICGTALHDQGPGTPSYSTEVTKSVLCFLDEFVGWFIYQSQRG